MILVGLDSWVFNDEWNKSCAVYNDFKIIQEIDRDSKVMLKAIISDWISGKWTFKDLDIYAHNIGFNGCVKDNGFMYDGSYYYGEIYRNPQASADYQFADTLKRISDGRSRFEWGEHIDEDTVKQLENLLLYCNEKNISVVGFITPFAPSIYKEMEKGGHYGYLGEIEPMCEMLFEKYGFEFYNFASGESLGLTDDYFVDGFHGSEVLYGYIVKKMVERDSEISKYINQKRLDNLLENTFSTLVFNNPDKR